MDLPQLTQAQQVALLMPCVSDDQQEHERYRAYQVPWSLMLTVDHVRRVWKGKWAWHASVALMTYNKLEGQVERRPFSMWTRGDKTKAQRLLDGLLRGVGAGLDEKHSLPMTLQTWRPLTEEEKRIALTRVPEDWMGG